VKILGTILESKAVGHRSWAGWEYRVQWDKNPGAKSMDGRAGTAVWQGSLNDLWQGTRVVLEYRTTPSSGLWFIARKQEAK
jgi:hypothetical protein